MPTTTALAIPYPPPTGVAPDVPYHLQQLAEKVESILKGRTWAPTKTGWDLLTSAAQSIPTATATSPTWDTEATDTDGFHTGTAQTVTIPAGLGGVYCMGLAVTATATLTGRCFLDLALGGNNYRLPFPAGDDRAALSITVTLPDNTTVVPTVLHTSGAARNLSARFQGWRIAQ